MVGPCGLIRLAVVSKVTANTRSIIPRHHNSKHLPKNETIAMAGFGEHPSHERSGHADGHIAIPCGQYKDCRKDAASLQEGRR